jgi:hypothetical protein
VSQPERGIPRNSALTIQNSGDPVGRHRDLSRQFRGAGDAQQFMNTFNTTLWNELESSGQFKMVPRTSYPLQVPQQPSDFHPPLNGKSQGPWLSDWSGPPVNSNYLAFGYTAVQNNQLFLYGWLYDVQQASTTPRLPPPIRFPTSWPRQGRSHSPERLGGQPPGLG